MSGSSPPAAAKQAGGVGTKTNSEKADTEALVVVLVRHISRGWHLSSRKQREVRIKPHTSTTCLRDQFPGCVLVEGALASFAILRATA